MRHKQTLTDIDKFYLEYHRDTPIAELVTTLNAEEEIVNDFLKSLPPIPEPKPVTAIDLMRRDSEQGKNKVTVMTQAASERADESYGRNHKKEPDPRCVFKIDPTKKVS
jgi:hypothetical protein